MKCSRLFPLILAFLVLFSLACSKNRQLAKRSESYLKKGDYYQASILAISSLQLNPANQTALETLHYSHPRAVEKLSLEIQNLKKDKQAKNWPQILDKYLVLESLNNQMRALPALLNHPGGAALLFDAASYAEQIAEARFNAAEYHYQKGIHYSLQSNQKDIQRQAAEEFKNALAYEADHKDAFIRYREAQQKAVKRIAVLPFEDKSGSGRPYGASGEILAEYVISSLLQNSRDAEYLEIISRDQIDRVLKEQELAASGYLNENSTARLGQLLGVDEILSGKILQIDYKAPRTVYVDITVKEEKSADELKEAEKSKAAECVYTKYQKTSSLKAMVSYYVIDISTGKIQSQKSFNESHEFVAEWARLQSGDTSMLNHAQKALLEKPEAIEPSDKEMLNSVFDDISGQISREFFRYFK